VHRKPTFGLPADGTPPIRSSLYKSGCMEEPANGRRAGLPGLRFHNLRHTIIHSTGRDDSGSSHGVDHRTPVAPVVGTLFVGQIDAKIRAPEGLDAWRGKAANEVSFEVRIQWVCGVRSQSASQCLFGRTFESSNLPETEGTERCPSGLRSTLGKRVLGKLNRGFESHPLRHFIFYKIVTTKNSVGRQLNEVSRTPCPLRPRSNVGPRRWEKQDADEAYSATQLDRGIVNSDQIRTVIRTFRDRLPEIFPGRQEVPKTLVFAKTHSHADDIIQTAREEFAQGNDFCKKMTYQSKEDPKSVLAHCARTSIRASQ
jgi:hypothetical protein